MLVLSILGFVLLDIIPIVSGVCMDLDSEACRHMAAIKSEFCADKTLSGTACPKFCNLCPIQCYSCNSTLSDYHLCKTTVTCQTGEVCMRRQLRSIVDGHEEYELSCATKEFCDDPWQGISMFGKRDLKPRDVSVSCCTTDGCNYPSEPTIPPTTVKVTTEKPTTSTANPTTTTVTTTARPTTTTTTTHAPTTTARPTTKTTTTTTTTQAPTTTAKHTTRAHTTVKHTTHHATTIDPYTGPHKGCYKDLMIVVDESTSMHSTPVKHFLQSIVSSLPIGTDQTLVSLGLFSSGSRTLFNIGDNLSQSSTNGAIGNMHFHGGRGDINKAIAYVVQHAATSSGGDRHDFPNVVLLITDGTSSRVTYSDEIALHSKADHVISVEIGVHFGFLASDPRYSLSLSSQYGLHSISSKVADLICEHQTTQNGPPHSILIGK